MHLRKSHVCANKLDVQETDISPTQLSGGKDNLKKKHLIEIGWEKVPNCECLVVHRKQGLFSSVHVDDTRMAGKKQYMDPMWKKLMKHVDIDEPTSLLDHVYLGRTQQNFSVVLRHGRTCSKMRGTVLQIGKQEDGANFQGFQSLFGRSPNEKREELENKCELPEVCSHIV